MLFTKRNLAVGTTLLVGFSGVLLGCGDAEPLGPGALEVTWETSPRSCEESGVEKVSIELKNDDVTVENIFDCVVGSATIEEIEPAEYTLLARGLDADNANIFISPETKVTVVGDSTRTVDTLVLTAKPAELRVEWRFDGGAMCNSVGVTEVQVSLFDESDFSAGEGTFGCNEGFTVFEDLKGAGTYTVIVEGEGTDSVVYKAEENIELARGEEGQVTVYLEEQ